MVLSCLVHCRASVRNIRSGVVHISINLANFPAWLVQRILSILMNFRPWVVLLHMLLPTLNWQNDWRVDTAWPFYIHTACSKFWIKTSHQLFGISKVTPDNKKQYSFISYYWFTVITQSQKMIPVSWSMRMLLCYSSTLIWIQSSVTVPSLGDSQMPDPYMIHTTLPSHQ